METTFAHYFLAKCQEKSNDDKIEEKLGKWVIFKSPKKYINLVVVFINGKINGLKLLGYVLNLKHGPTTNANELSICHQSISLVYPRRIIIL
ncbi:MAG: hypothetical protein ACP6IU_08810 [Candidatus Asgardarchaeia archaeon]